MGGGGGGGEERGKGRDRAVSGALHCATVL